MIRILTSGNTEALQRRLSAVGAKVKSGLPKVLREALKATKPDIRAGVRGRYTYKGAIPMRVKASGAEGTLTIKGGRNSVRKFKYRAPGKRGKRKYLRVWYLHGSEHTYVRGFAYSGTYFERVGRPRYPIRKVTGASVPEMAGHEPEPARAIEAALGRHLNEKMEAIM